MGNNNNNNRDNNKSYNNNNNNNNNNSDVVDKYSTKYEARMNPFQAFHRQERNKRYIGLSPHEKATLG